VTAASHCADGDEETRGTIIATLKGDAQSILLLERTALNLLGRMSGIATTTHTLSIKVRKINHACNVAATRKTAPGLRLLDKKAVLIGGGDPHRFSLSDAILIKDNHRVLVSLTEAIRRARNQSAYHLIEAEAETIEEAAEAAEAGVNILLLDNMSPEMVGKTVRELEMRGLRAGVTIEVSGMITPDNIEEYANLPIDRISLGMLTHSVRSIDFSLDVSQEI
jgi:nicotinate-nucleotide pyrophosphorylase (carboxylating)